MNLQSLIKTVLYKAGYSIKKIHHAPRPKAGGTGSQSDSSGTDVMGLLHKINPYEGFDFSALPFDGHGWGGDSPAFRELVTKVKPGLIIEVGTWKGASALEMAAVVRELGLSTRIVCVDTWLGALEFWKDQSDPERYLSLQLRHGFPTVYYQFLANVCHKGCQDIIIPFPQTASTAALWFRSYGIRAEMIYIDASHEEEDVYQDLNNFWEVATSDGLLFGDDYSWDGVRLAVTRFAREMGVSVTFAADKWILQKHA